MELSSLMSDEEILGAVRHFNNKHSSPISKLTVDFQGQKKIWSTLQELIAEEERKSCFGALLQASKILTRNRELMASVVQRETLELLLLRAGILTGANTQSVREDLQGRDITAIDEALRCLSNIYLQCAKTHAALSLEKDIISGIMCQVKRYKELAIPLSIISFDMRLLFLVTAYFPESRVLLCVDHRGMSRLTDLLGLCLDTAKERTSLQKENKISQNLSYSETARNNREVSTSPKEEQYSVVLNEDEVTVLTSTLKVLFNCTCAVSPEINTTLNQEEMAKKLDNVDEELVSNLSELCRILHLLLTLDKECDELKTMITKDVINVLTNFPVRPCTEPLLLPLDKELIANAEDREIEYDGVCMNAPKEILDFLMETIEKFRRGSPTVSTMRDGITPVLKVLCSLSIGQRLIRKYYRSIVLPPLRDLTQRPEAGDSIRSRLCRLLTSPETSVSTMVAEFLFILCKEDVKRLVKHTGYGNAAGLLARHGLMCGGRGSEANQYSDDDDDSDTEEYRQNAHMVNPVSGYVEPERPSPFAGMSEEQKEHEAMKLANLIDRLHSMGIVKPGKLGPDGKPTAVDHVLELVENHSAQIGDLQPRDDSDDSDDN